MCNEAIKIAIEKKPKNRFELCHQAYPRLKEHGLHTHYALSACEVAYSVYRNKRRKLTPRIVRPFLKLDNQSYKLDHLLLRIPTTPRNFIFLILQGSQYHMSFIEDSTLKRGSIVVTERTVNIPFSKEVSEFEPRGCIGLDVNERNVTVSSSNGWTCRFSEMNEIAELKERYREIRAKIARTKGRDRRVCAVLLARNGKRERNRTEQRAHVVTKRIVDAAREQQLGIKMERLFGIRRLYAKNNGQGNLFRARMNTWVFGEILRQVDYKAKWIGVPRWFVNPRGTSRNCPDCGSRVAPLAGRKLYCLKCDKTWDRDDLASKNIMACAVPQARPFMGSGEGERGADGSNPPSRWREGKPGG